MPLRHTLLGLLHGAPMHGYLLRSIARGYSWIYPMTNTSIYPALHSLERDGFVTHDSEVHNGRARKVYDVTPAGRDELRRWLCEEPEAKEFSLRDPSLLKISMMSDDVVRGAGRPWLERAIAQLEEQIDRSERRLKDGDPVEGELGGYGRLAVEFGLDMLRLRVRFLQRVLDSPERDGR